MLDPLFMHLSDNPVHAIVNLTPSNQNYHTWSRSIKVELRSKKKLGFINKTLIHPPKTEHTFMTQGCCNTMVMSCITNSTNHEIAESILWMETAKEIWEELKERYHQRDIFRISDLQEEIYALRQGYQNVSQCFTILKKMWQYQDNFPPLPTYVYDIPYPCSLLMTIKGYKDNDHVIRFLKGLNEQYAPVRSQIILMQPLLPINKVLSMLIQQEQ